MLNEFCCKPFGERILDNLPFPMDHRLLKRIVHLTISNPDFPRILNRDLRPVLQDASVSSPNGPASNHFTPGVPCALDAYRQFTTPVYAVFSWCNQDLPTPHGDIQEIITFIVFRNKTLQGYLRD
jgi:hypothetical protein